MKLEENRDLGAIARGESYAVHVFQRITGLSTFAFRGARARGLKVRQVGRRLFVCGDDWLNFLQSEGVDTRVVPEPERDLP